MVQENLSSPKWLIIKTCSFILNLPLVQNALYCYTHWAWWHHICTDAVCSYSSPYSSPLPALVPSPHSRILFMSEFFSSSSLSSSSSSSSLVSPHALVLFGEPMSWTTTAYRSICEGLCTAAQTPLAVATVLKNMSLPPPSITNFR